ncbi:MAG: AraC family transcriptional regulator ligand-binding domain-containing protein [Acidobacteriota bacterium]
MGWISAVFAHKVVGIAAGDGPGGQPLRQRLLRAAGLDPASSVDPERLIGDADFFGLLERVASEVEGGRDVPLRVGASMRCDDYGAFGLAFKSAVTLESAYVRVERYGRIVTSIANFRVARGEGSAFMEVIPGDDPRPGLLMTNELALAAATALSREVGEDDFIPLRVHISHAAPARRSAFEAHFRCPIEFGAPRDALEVSHDRLRHPNRLGDTSLSRFFDTHLDGALAELPEDGGLARRVRAEVTQALSEGVPTLPQMAARLGMSGRTLQRRMKEAGLGYRDLVDEARRGLAHRLLRQTDYGLAEIAFLTGFSEQSAFHRAFTRWTQETPGTYRQKHRIHPGRLR